MIPTMQMYQKTLETETFRDMLRYAKGFHKIHRKCLQKKPMIEYWSRRWEYPFVYEHIKNHIKTDRMYYVMDAGSGITFFPSYVSCISGNRIQVLCVDEEDLAKEHLKTGIRFSQQDLAKMNYPDDTFDIVYSISVLEHTYRPEMIIGEIKRVLKPDGLFILTFDISLDCMTAIDPWRAEELLDTVQEHFVCIDGNCRIDLEQDILTTRKVDESLLPWYHTASSILGSIRRFQLPKKGFRHLTVFGGTFKCRR